MSTFDKYYDFSNCCLRAWQRNRLNFVPHIRDGIELMTGDKILSGKIKNVCVNVR